MVELNKRKILQMLYDTDADYELTKKKIVSTDYGYCFEDPDNPSGRCTICFLDKKYSDIVYFTKGVVQITYHSIKELEEIKEHIFNLFVTREGKQANMYNERSNNFPLYQQLKNIDMEIDNLILRMGTLKTSTPFGYVSVKDCFGNLIHPFIPEIKKKIRELVSKKNELFPYCEGPLKDNELCKSCSGSQSSTFLRSNFGPKPVKYCPLYNAK